MPRSLVADLRHSREVLTDIEGQLGSLLLTLRQPKPGIDAGAPDRLSCAVAQVGSSLAALDNLRRLW